MDKYRHELKYVISEAQFLLLKSRIQHMMQLDPHVSDSGIYNIRSLYFDDYCNSCYHENENGTDPREKMRIRIYNHSSDRILLECKRKEKGKVLKKACLLSEEQTEKLIRGEILNLTEQQPLLEKMLLQMRVRLFKPVTIVEYERTPYIHPNGNVRVTFDTEISSSDEISGFLHDWIPKRPIMPSGWHLMEVKFDEYLPDYIYRALNLDILQQTAYSKYCMCRRYALKGAGHVFY